MNNSKEKCLINWCVPEDVEWHSAFEKPITLYGVSHNESGFARLPDTVIEKLPHLAELSKNPAGGRLRFKTDSPYITVRAYCDKMTDWNHMNMTMQAGFDCYETRDLSHRCLCTLLPPAELKSGRFATFNYLYTNGRLTDITLNLPGYGFIRDIEIGIKRGCKLEETDGYIDKKPIVFYGSSITQGACASRPGLTYENIISRYFNIDYINLGFSASCKGEDAMTDYLASLDCSVFVCDYDHNTTDYAVLKETHWNLYEKVRKAHPDIPYIIINRQDPERDFETAQITREIILGTYDRARKTDKNVHFIDGYSLYNGINRGDCTVDGIHPNDIGMMRMGEALIGHMQWML